MHTVNGGYIFARALKQAGVEQIFTICGGQIMPLIYGCRNEGIKVIDVRHENAGVYAADAYARATGKIGVVLTTVTPGALQSMQGMGEARAANSPVLIISGSIALSENESGAEQDFDTYNVIKSNAVWSAKIFEPTRIMDYVYKAVRYANGALPGPVYLECPVNVMKAKVEEQTLRYMDHAWTTAQPFGDPFLISKAAELLANAKRPVLTIGDMASYTREYGEYVGKLVQKINMPVFATATARGLFGDECNPLFEIGEAALAEADVILTLSANMNFRLNCGQPPIINSAAKFIQIHPSKTHIGFNAPADIGIVAGAGAGAMQLYEALKDRKIEDKKDWITRAEQLHAALRSQWTQGYQFRHIEPMHPGRCANEIGNFLNGEGADWSLAVDGGDAYEWVMRAVKAHRPGQIVGYGPNGTIGTGQGFAMGLWQAHKKPVLLYTGDGSFGFHAMEFETMARHGMQVICVISNDSQWGMVKMAETDRNRDEVAKGYLATDLVYRPYHEMARIWGGYGELVTDSDEIIPAIKRACTSKKPGIINVKVNSNYPCPFTKAYGCGG